MTLRDSLARILRRLNRTSNPQSRRARRRLLLENMEERRLMAIDLQLMSADDGLAIYGAAAGDWSGAAVSRAGDVNGDGFDDMLVGAVYGDSGAKSNTGASYLIYGGPTLPSLLDLANLGTAGVKILGADAGDGSGGTLSAADVNGDGFSDLIIGSPSADGVNNSRPNSGETYVIFGSASLPSVIDLSVVGSAGLTIYGAGNGDQSGSAVASAGDVNGDGYADFMIGASYADGSNNAKADSGESYLIYGAANLPSSIDLANLQTGQATVFLGVDAGDYSGWAVGGAGDVNGDGLADLLIGAIYGSGENNAWNMTDAGESYLIFGSRNLPAAVNLGSLGAAGLTVYGADESELSGVSVSGAGDVNGDGYDDFLIGSFLSDGPTNDTFAVGLTSLIFGAANLPTQLNLANLGSLGIAMYGDNYFDSVGWSVSSAGDVNADGFDDLLIGATYPSDQPNASYTARGKTFVVYGAAQLDSQINLSSLEATGIEYIGGDTGDTSGWSVSGVGDVNGDGFSDFMIGAPSADAANNAKSAAGESYLLYGSRQASGVTIPGSANSETLTGSSSADTINGSRSDDTIVSAGGADVLFGGEGNDVFDISDLNFRQVNGGSGSDTLRIAGNDMHLDLTTLANNRLRSIEQIDLRGAGANVLTLNQLELLNLSSESNTLIIRRDATDTIDFGPDWITGTLETIGQEIFQVYTQGAATLKVQVPNQAPTGIQLVNVITELPENTDTSSSIKLADILIQDDGQGVNTLSLSGADAGSFEVINTATGSALYLRAGVALSYATKTTYNVTINVDDSTVGTPIDATSTYSLNLTSVNAPVVLTVDNAQVTGTVHSTLTNTGTWYDPEGGEVTLTASIGTVIKNTDGTWSWAYTSQQLAEGKATITASTQTSTFDIDFAFAAFAGLSNSWVYYRGSSYSQGGTNIEAALDTSKTLIVADAEAQTTSFANVTSYTRGINGIVLEVPGLPAGALSDADFSFRMGTSQTPGLWGTAPLPNDIIVTSQTGASAPRIRIEWEDNAIQNTWLQVTIHANENTGLNAPVILYIGHVLAEIDGVSPYRRTSIDVGLMRKEVRNTLVPIDNPYDIDKDRRVTSIDVGILRGLVSNSIVLNALIVPPAGE